MSANPTNPDEVKLLPPVGEAGRPPAPNAVSAGTAPIPMPVTPPTVAPAPAPATVVTAVTTSSSAPRQLADLPKDELNTLAEEFGLEPRRYKTPQDLVAAIHGKRQLIASLDREALLDVVRWGRRPVPINATNEMLAHEILRIKSMRFDGLTERGLVTLARLRGCECGSEEPVPAVVKKLKKQESVFAKLNRKRRAFLGSIVSNMIGEDDTSAEYQFLPPADGGQTATLSTPPSPAVRTTASAGGTGGAGATAPPRDRSIKEEIEESGLFGGIASRVKKTADQYINQKLDEIESRIDRKLDEIDRRLAEWRDKEIANRIRILKITLWASVIVASLSLVYSYVKVNFWDKGANAAPSNTPAAVQKVDRQK